MLMKMREFARGKFLSGIENREKAAIKNVLKKKLCEPILHVNYSYRVRRVLLFS